MVYKMRFVQSYDKRDEAAFLALEKSFIELEEKTENLKKGRRYVSVMGREAVNTMIWEAEYDSMEEAVRALKAIQENPEHDALLEKQVCFMRDSYVELYQQIG